VIAAHSDQHDGGLRVAVGVCCSSFTDGLRGREGGLTHARHHRRAMHEQPRRFILASLAGVVLVGALISPIPALAGKGKGKGKGHAKLDRMCEQLACTETQARDIEQIFEQLRVDSKPEREAIRELRRQLTSEWKTDQPDERELAKLADKIAAHERNLADRRMEAMLELHGLLTAVQREQVAEHVLAAGHRKRD
jgi:Spy/CpxP family protein refolding chaperone